MQQFGLQSMAFVLGLIVFTPAMSQTGLNLGLDGQAQDNTPTISRPTMSSPNNATNKNSSGSVSSRYQQNMGLLSQQLTEQLKKTPPLPSAPSATPAEIAEEATLGQPTPTTPQAASPTTIAPSSPTDFSSFAPPANQGQQNQGQPIQPPPQQPTTNTFFGAQPNNNGPASSSGNTTPATKSPSAGQLNINY